MKKFFKAIGVTALYLLLYFAVQFVVILIPTLAFMIPKVVELLNSGLNSTMLANTLAQSLYDFVYSNMALLTLIANLATVGAFALVFTIRKRKIADRLTLRRIAPMKLIPVFCAGIFLDVFVDFLIPLLPLPAEAVSEADKATKALFNGNPIVVFLCVVIIGPIVEEILFRGIIYTTLKRNTGTVFAMILSSLIFGSFHLQPVRIAYAFAIGLLLAVIFQKYKTLWASITLHIAFNAAAFAISFTKAESAGIPLQILIVIGSGVLSAVFLYFIFGKKRMKPVIG